MVYKHGYSAKLVRVVDGDTCDAMIDLGFDTWIKKRIRFMGVDTWESRTRDLEEKKKGLEAKAFTKEILESNKGKFDIMKDVYESKFTWTREFTFGMNYNRAVILPSDILVAPILNTGKFTDIDRISQKIFL